MMNNKKVLVNVARVITFGPYFIVMACTLLPIKGIYESKGLIAFTANKVKAIITKKEFQKELLKQMEEV